MIVISFLQKLTEIFPITMYPYYDITVKRGKKFKCMIIA